MNLKKKWSPGTIFAFTIVFLGACTMILPFVWMISTSLKEANLVYKIPPEWLPNPVDWKNYIEIWKAADLVTGIFNSCLITAVVLTCSTLTSTMSAFAFSKLRFPGSSVIFLMLMSTMMVPGVVLLVPSFILYSKLGWIDTLLPLIVPVSLCNISNIFFMRQFMTGLPKGYLDAALIDGCSYFKAYWRIFLPMCKPAIVTNGIMLFMGTWNDYMGPMIYTHSPEKRTIQLAIALLSSHYEQQTDIPLVMAASLIALLPVLILFITCQKYFVDSLALTGIKG
jgi:multiple sugar transport system permease protein